MWYTEKMPQRNQQRDEVFERLKPLTELATGLIPRSNFDTVAERLGITRPALTGRELPELILAISASARSLGGLGQSAPQIRRPRCQRADDTIAYDTGVAARGVKAGRRQ